MVNLMLQPVFLNLVKGSTDHKMTSDDLYNMWSVASRAKSAIVQGRRLENLSWRLWYTSTIRSKIEMEEKRRRSAEQFNDDNEGEEVDIINVNSEGDNEMFIETETENESNTSTTSSSPNSKSKIKNKHKKKKESALVLPSDRPLFTSTCTSILAEIQDASFRFSTGGSGAVGNAGFNINQSHFYTSSHHHHNNHGHNSNTANAINHVNIISPPTNRSKSPGISSISASNFTPKRKKNVEKFLKKFKTNLEDISEQIDEKLNFSDEETEDQKDKEKEKDITTDASIKSLSPTASSNHFATDEEGQQYHSTSFYHRDDLINMERAVAIKKKSNQPSMISKLLKKESIGSNSSINSNNNNFNNFNYGIRSISPNSQAQAPNFLFNQNINDQLDLMASNRQHQVNNNNNSDSGTSSNIKTPHSIPEMITEKRVIDANALSTSLSASKFKLEDEFDSQLVIW